MNIDELTLGQIKEINKLTNSNVSSKQHPFEIGANYLIRTVTMIQCGTLVDVFENELILENASWVADTGRFKQAVETGSFDEVEPFPPSQRVIIGRNALIDAVKVNFKLPMEQK